MVEESMKKIQQFNESQSTSANSSLKNDALSHTLGQDRPGRVKGLGFGVTMSKLKAQSHSKKLVTALEEKIKTMEANLELLMKTHNEVGSRCSPEVNTTGQNQASNIVVGTVVTHEHDPPVGAKCKLMSWYNKGEVVAEGEIFSRNPSDLVHFKPLGLAAWKVSVDFVVNEKAFLWRSSDELKVIEEAIGSTVARNKEFITFVFS